MRGDRIRLVFVALCAGGCAATTPGEPKSSEPSCCAPAAGAAVAGAPVAGSTTAQAVPDWTTFKLSSETWHIEGSVADACQCIVFCPCEFHSLPSEGLCDDTALIHIEKGNFGGIPLDGIDVVVATESPNGKRMVDNVGNLTWSAPGIGDMRIARSTDYDYMTEGRARHYGGRSASFRSFTLEGMTVPQ